MGVGDRGQRTRAAAFLARARPARLLADASEVVGGGRRVRSPRGRRRLIGCGDVIRELGAP